jgi:hypothetical protein
MDNQEAREWAKKISEESSEWSDMVGRVASEAIDYVQMVVQNMEDPNWRRMVVNQHVREMGVATRLAHNIIPDVYMDMHKSIHKKLKVKKEVGTMLANIYLARVIKNIVKELENGKGE